jgi:putative addiction module component (TIGR02574 family)
METIVLEIDEASAKAWNNSSPSLRAAYESKIVAIVKEFQDTEQIDEDGFTKAQRDFLAKDAAENTERYEWWNDEEMIAELDRRSADLRSGKVKGVSLEETKERLLNRMK